MKIPNDKQVLFIKKLIEDTKSGDIYWDGLSSSSALANHAFPNYTLDSEGFFSCGFRNKLGGNVYLALCIDGKVRCRVGATHDVLVPLSSGVEEIEVLLTRLFNLIYDKRPTANKFVDQYLNLSGTANAQSEDSGQ